MPTPNSHPEVLRLAILVDSSSDPAQAEQAAAVSTVFEDRVDVAVDVTPERADVLVVIGSPSGDWNDHLVDQTRAFVERVGPERVVVVVAGAEAGARIAEIAGDGFAALFPIEPLWIDSRAGAARGLQAIVGSIESERSRRSVRPTGVIAPSATPAMAAPVGRTVACPNCQAKNSVRRTFCEICGTSLPVANEPGSPSGAPMPAGSGGSVGSDARKRSHLRAPMAGGMRVLVLVLVLLVVMLSYVSGSTSDVSAWRLVGLGLVAVVAAISFALGRRSGGASEPTSTQQSQPSLVPPAPPEPRTLVPPPTPTPVPSPLDQPPPRTDRALAFVSFSTADDSAVTVDVVSWMGSVMDVWFAPAKVRAGQEWIFELSDALERADYFVLLVTQNSMSSKWVRHELGAALRRSVETGVPALIPLMLERCEVPILLGNFQMIDATGLRGDRLRERLVAALA